jgi:sporulation protein YlmC with PRC-barrel domain
MIIDQGEKVLTADGEVVGEINRVVLDPKTKEVTHIVVKEGVLFTEERVVPIDLVQYSDEDEVKLRDIPVDYDELPVFEETHYIPLNDEEIKRMRSGDIPPAYYHYPPLYPGGWMSERAVARPYLEKTVENIPEGTVALKEGAIVKDIVGDTVGEVKEILTDVNTDQVTHLVISEGVFLKEKKSVPIEWVTTIKEGEVHLAVGPKILETLPSF